MYFNLTGFDPDTFYAVNSAVHVLLFSIFHLPAFLLDVLCIGALLFAKAINWQIKATIINIFAAEIIGSIGVSIFYIGYPMRAKDGNEIDYSCKTALGIVILSFLANATAVTAYAITVYVFIKCGPEKLKWYLVAASIAAPWILYITIALAIMNTLEISSNHGFCFAGQGPANSQESNALLAISGLVLFVDMVLTCIFGILTYCHVRKNALSEGSSANKKSIAKILLYHLIKMLILLAQYMISAVLGGSLSPENGYDGVVKFLVIQYLVVDAVINITTMLTPIVSLVILQPLHDVLKVVRKKVCSCCKQGAIDLAPEYTVETVL